jgi:hypothetical protein
MAHITLAMYERRFSRWMTWVDRDALDESRQPGVYVIAVTPTPIRGRKFSWRRDIIYVGMTNSVTGLRGRLRQFDQTMLGSLRHGGADRVRVKHRNYTRFAKHAYVALAPFSCAPGSSLPRDLKVMGEVARFEYLCLAAYAAKFDRLPEFNDRKTPKDSRTPARFARRPAPSNTR